MDTRTLVEEQVEAGSRFVRFLHTLGFDVTVAGWAQAGEDGEWLLYIASADVEKRGFSRSYRTIFLAVRELASPWGTFSTVKLLATDDPIAQALLRLRQGFTGLAPSSSTYLPGIGTVAVCLPGGA